jgi:hypothetical protein
MRCYDDSSQAILRQAFSAQKDSGECILNMDGWSYAVDFDTMRRQYVTLSGENRSLRREIRVRPEASDGIMKAP